ncbi:methylated-DNA--[protein]-cysteine S-methyltransferase [Clostridium estertheticum]|uniref:Methylated-DNA--protein-cysteine methyltransferase n=1 Tax=Clostridium estertheticum subsp. estertheticum TaxID=1552 RepID=A0A1J0GP14_9CLOT|nr:methylated-DNA--[protein]-cysteine S-methyltransferase [Clostridium estertheticum]APC42656.1 cysteine methyltransferase [Clostridium estertheticum subsp. estertheticum]MBU3075551.1 methylated-DNA--[protein]-cysteine S-methyltransferase [Clostridium estertheticum]MBU3165619.1 methylated-DNA--[protein]-cysteine S-methyltransferase [Clostridium estertheticum]MBU3174490.1 methylated-DNA--[protein]-cysteine S-methyltransferase [Clostridium estertheticum]MBZ9617821.1 methylated-DNA--[protein]-cys
MNNIFYYETIIGKIGIVENGIAITQMNFARKMPEGININETVLIKKANMQLQEYFSGKRKTFDLPLAPSGTEFQQKVWSSLLEIPYGKTNSYKDIAKNVGNINAARAVGMANSKNPIFILIPCHRVIGANGKLVGYAGGLSVKEKLLEIEKQNENN